MQEKMQKSAKPKRKETTNDDHPHPQRRRLWVGNNNSGRPPFVSISSRSRSGEIEKFSRRVKTNVREKKVNAGPMSIHNTAAFLQMLDLTAAMTKVLIEEYWSLTNIPQG
jgi:hypothetical protein